MVLLFGICLGFACGVLTCTLVGILKENSRLKKEKKISEDT